MEQNKIAKLASKLMIEIIKTDLPNKEINRLNDIVGDIRDEAINYSQCCKTLKSKEETAFDLWLKNFKHAERDLYWYNEDTLYCIEAMKDIYNTEVKPTL